VRVCAAHLFVFGVLHAQTSFAYARGEGGVPKLVDVRSAHPFVSWVLFAQTSFAYTREGGVSKLVDVCSLSHSLTLVHVRVCAAHPFILGSMCACSLHDLRAYVLCVCVCVCMRVCAACMSCVRTFYVCVCVCARARMHTYIPIHTHTQTAVAEIPN
jgi:hypothetical protein